MDFNRDFYTEFRGHDIGDINCFTYHRRCPIRYRLKPAVRIWQRYIHPQSKGYFDDELGLSRDAYAYSDSELLDQWNRRPSYTGSMFETTSIAQYDNEVPCFPEWEETKQKLHAGARSESLPPSQQDFHHRFWTGLPPEHERYKYRFPNSHDTYWGTQDYSAKDDDLESYLDSGSLSYTYLCGGKRRRHLVPDPYRDSHDLYGTSNFFEASNTDDDESVHGSEDERGRAPDLDPWPLHKSFSYTPETLRNSVNRSGGLSTGDTMPIGGSTMFTHQQSTPQATTAEIRKDHEDRFQGEHVNRMQSDLRCETVTDVDEELLFSIPNLEATADLDQEHASMLNHENTESGTERYVPSPSLPARNPTRHFFYFNRLPLRHSNYISSSGRPPRHHPSFGRRFRSMSRSQWRRRHISDLRMTSLNQAAINSARRKIEKDRAHLQQVREELEQDREKVERERQHLVHDYAECCAIRSRLRQHHEELRMGNQKLEEAWEDLRQTRMQGSGGGRPWGQSWKPPNPLGCRGYDANRPKFTRCGNYHEPDLGDFEDWDGPNQEYTRPQDAVAAAKALETYTFAWRTSPKPPPVIWPTCSLTSASLLILPPLVSRIPETWFQDANSKRHEITKYNTIVFFASAFALDIIVTWPRDKEEEYEFQIPELEKVESGVLGKMKECVGEEVKRWHQDKSDLWGLREGERELAFAIFEGCVELRKCVRGEAERRRRVCGGR